MCYIIMSLLYNNHIWFVSEITSVSTSVCELCQLEQSLTWCYWALIHCEGSISDRKSGMVQVCHCWHEVMRGSLLLQGDAKTGLFGQTINLFYGRYFSTTHVTWYQLYWRNQSSLLPLVGLPCIVFSFYYIFAVLRAWWHHCHCI